MKNQTQNSAVGSPKVRRKSETLTLSSEAALALKQLVARFHAEERLTRDAHGMARLRRGLGNRLLAMACEAVMEIPGSIHIGCAWWKLVLTEMCDEEMAAENAMIHARIESEGGGSLAPIDDAQEAEAIRKLSGGKEAA